MPLSLSRAMLVALVGLSLAGAGSIGSEASAQEREQPDEARASAQRGDVLTEVASFRVRGLSAPQAAREIVLGGRIGAEATARILHAAAYAPRAIQDALVATFRLPESEAARFVQAATSTIVLGEERARGPDPGMRVEMCFGPDGSLFACPPGSMDVAPGPDYSDVDWGGVILTPANDATAGSELVIRLPAGVSLSAVTVELAGQPLFNSISGQPPEVRVRLPNTAVAGELRMRHLGVGVDVALAADYRVRARGVLDELDANATGHSWVNSYLLALASYYIYSDALGDPADSREAFEDLMLGWGMEVVHFEENEGRHLRAAVVRGESTVLVVFRGSEQQSQTHCVAQMEMVLPEGICAELWSNWVDNFQARPMRHRSEWGAHFRTHTGIDGATEILFADVLAKVKQELTNNRKLFVTGHSLGGAMAALFAYRANIHEHVHVQGVYTYGAPRLVNIPFTEVYDPALGARVQRWQNRSDPIPGFPLGQPIQSSGLLPPLAWETYRHVGSLNYLPARGPAELDRQAEPAQAATSAAQMAGSDHLMADSVDSYAARMHERLPPEVLAVVPCPPGGGGAPGVC